MSKDVVAFCMRINMLNKMVIGDWICLYSQDKIIVLLSGTGNKG